MKTNKAGIDLIKHFESCKLTAYPDPATGGKPWTIGWGTTRLESGRAIEKGMVITLQTADKLFLHDIAHYEKAVDAIVRDDVNENQFSALVSFAYNCGERNLRNSTLLKKVNKRPSDPTIHKEFQKWVYANGKKMNGLVRRRLAEANLYFKQIA